jgi:hypothetical protein
LRNSLRWDSQLSGAFTAEKACLARLVTLHNLFREVRPVFFLETNTYGSTYSFYHRYYPNILGGQNSKSQLSNNIFDVVASTSPVFILKFFAALLPLLMLLAALKL